MYMRRRFQGISLEEQMRLQKKRGKKAVVRRRSSAADSKVSVQTNRSARVRSVNPFGLQVRYPTDKVYYSGTSVSGPSEIGTHYNRPLYKGHRARSQKFASL